MRKWELSGVNLDLSEISDILQLKGEVRRGQEWPRLFLRERSSLLVRYSCHRKARRSVQGCWKTTGTVKKTLLGFVFLFAYLMMLNSWPGEVIKDRNTSPPGKTTEVKSTPIFIRLPFGTYDPLSQTGPMNLPEELIIDTYPPEEPGYYILQFKGPVQEEWKEVVSNVGGKFFDYIPDFAFIVKMDRRTKLLVEALNSVRWVGIYQPAYRISPDLVSPVAKGGVERLVDVIVTVFQGEPLPGLVENIEAVGGDVVTVSEGKWKNKIRVRIEPRHLVEIAKMMDVKWIERAPEFELFPAGQKKGVE